MSLTKKENESNNFSYVNDCTNIEERVEREEEEHGERERDRERGCSTRIYLHLNLQRLS